MSIASSVLLKVYDYIYDYAFKLWAMLKAYTDKNAKLFESNCLSDWEIKVTALLTLETLVFIDVKSPDDHIYIYL